MSSTRQEQSFNTRTAAAEIAASRPHPEHKANGEEITYAADRYLSSFTKGLPHDYETGLIQDPAHFEIFIEAVGTGAPADFVKTPLGPNGEAQNPTWVVEAHNIAGYSVRAWESQGAGHTFDLEGPDAQAVTMPPAPKLGSHELLGETGELYSQALLRDTPFSAMMRISRTKNKGHNIKLRQELRRLNRLPWFAPGELQGLSEDEKSRRRQGLTPQTAFRGITKGDDVGPYISQFLLSGSRGLGSGSGGGTTHDPRDGFIQYGSIRIDQRVRAALSNLNFMETWDEWFDVQNGIKLKQDGLYADGNRYRFIATPRDLATYVSAQQTTPTISTSFDR